MPSIAPTKDVLRKRVQRLLRLDRQSDDHSELRVRILPYLLSLGEVALIGGAIRDLARLGRNGFSSDLDFVIHSSNRGRFQDAMATVHAKPNRFGGFALPFHGWKVDVWHLEDTWARTVGLRQVEKLSDLLKCTFFDWDSVVFDVRTRHISFGDDYLTRLRSNVMDLCLEQNPNPSGSLVRALRRAALWNVRFGPNLTEFSRRNLGTLDWAALVALDKAAFTDAVLVYLDPIDLMRRLDSVDCLPGQRTTLPVPYWERQPHLPFSHPERTNLAPRL